MKLPTLTLLATILAVVPLRAGSPQRISGNKSVTVEIALKKTSLAPGASGEMAFTFAPVAGIHVNLKPPPEFTLDSSSLAALSGRLVLPKGTEYLKPSASVTQRFQLSPNAKPGPATLNGTLTYYFCSDKDGWCSKYKQPVAIALTVRR